MWNRTGKIVQRDQYNADKKQDGRHRLRQLKANASFAHREELAVVLVWFVVIINMVENRCHTKPQQHSHGKQGDPFLILLCIHPHQLLLIKSVNVII